MGNFKKKQHSKRDVKPLNDLELIRIGLRGEPLVIDRKVFIKSPEERKRLKELKKANKEYLASL